MILELITQDKKMFEQEAYEIILPNTSGQIAVLPGHIPLITQLTPGVISIRNKPGEADGNLDHLAVSGGLAEITGKKVRILSDSADRAEDLNELKIKEAHQQALVARRTARDAVSSADATAILERSLAQLKILELKKRRHLTR
ncbi:MAG: ATP synthase epsilon chain [Candidatus Berkelbacteria bacterium Licking1014_7]|uniref:ATP synthase epsilon chain n=1 Tax=Candidatus Berkelbacteria bacterium Licking1014_7 TaxID=2017147 RepID=A0A554LIU2_9BACT|nr:MAG: ATP synthase epsilon chain [Candidatus Berkelbacteria bacterium Licking1014_7]